MGGYTFNPPSNTVSHAIFRNKHSRFMTLVGLQVVFLVQVIKTHWDDVLITYYNFLTPPWYLPTNEVVHRKLLFRWGQRFHITHLFEFCRNQIFLYFGV